MKLCRFSFNNADMIKWLRFLNCYFQSEGCTFGRAEIRYYPSCWVDLRIVYLLKLLYNDVSILTKRTPGTFKGLSRKHAKTGNET